MSIWTKPISVEHLNQIHQSTAVARLGIEFTEVGDDFLIARIAVTEHTRQPAGILHGGASVVLAETIGSCGASFSCAPDCHAVGLEINANHIRSASDGWVTGIGRPLHRGRSTHVWQIELRDAKERLTCMSRITLSVISSDRLRGSRQ